jgi:8-oxo-dGTP pyrophosphatase MutT (NUDIX family)
MPQSSFNPLWLEALHVSANCPPLRPRQDLLLNGQRIGSVDPDCFKQLVPAGSSLKMPTFLLQLGDDGCLHMTGQGTEALDYIAQVCRAENIGCVREQWRDELLAVFNAENQRVAIVERGVARLLGIATRAVHLVGYAPSGQLWVQQRSLDKAIDPGLWDTLVGGVVPVSDNLTTALVRETWEEAGIKLDGVQQLRAGGRVLVQHPNARDGGMGYVVEQIDWFAGAIPDGITPVNQDGEVAQFALLQPFELKAQMESSLFTLDASLILTRALSK